MSSIKAQKYNQRGSTVLMMMVLLAGVMMATIAMFANSQVNDSSGSRFMARQRALYVSDGTRAFAIQLVQDFLKQKPTATGADIQTYLKTALPPLMPTDFSVQDITADIVSSSGGSTLIPNGTFKGMLAPQVQIKFSYTIVSGADSETRIVHSFDAVVDVAQVGLHQFMYFMDLQSAGYSPGTLTTVDGRMHSNGDLCLGGAAGLTLSKVTAAGRLLHSNRFECALNRTTYPYDKTFIASGTGLSNPKPFGLAPSNPDRNDNGCFNCLSSGLNWVDYALSEWNGNAQDVAQNVSKLTLPIPTDINAQVGANGTDAYKGIANNHNLRFLVDPVLPDDPVSVKKLKYSYQSDIRIIDGVWYIKKTANPDDWPGKPIWSDHPGTFTDAYGQAVGQADLKVALGWATVPKRFSYYDYDPATSSLTGAAIGTISYGGLARQIVAGKPNWTPGQLVGPTATFGGGATGYPFIVRGADYYCATPDPSSSTPGVMSAAPLATTMLPYTAALSCTTGTSPSVASALINGTRSGIDDAHAAIYAYILNLRQPNPGTYPNQRSHVLPVNFDANHFELALKDSSAGELGSYFPVVSGATSFNGIIYITTTYPGSMDGFSPRGAPAPRPIQNGGTWLDHTATAQASPGDTAQIPITSLEIQRSLPFQLCTNTSAISPKPGDPYDQVAGGFHFVIPNCADYPSSFWAYPSAIRIHNGVNLDPALFKAGLSIVSNMPVYVLGAYNQKSNVSGGPGASSKTPWMSSLIAGDQVTFLSDGWDDARAPFATFGMPANTKTSRPAIATNYTTSILSGWAMYRDESVFSNEALHALPGLMEDWSNGVGPALQLNMHGSIVIGYYPVFDRGGRYFYGNFDGSSTKSSYNYATYSAPKRQISFDKHLELISNQPPGSPTFYTSSTQSWKIK
jgi:hypothetical protein